MTTVPALLMGVAAAEITTGRRVTRAIAGVRVGKLRVGERGVGIRARGATARAVGRLQRGRGVKEHWRVA